VVKCPAFWRKALEFKSRGDFKGFKEWCEAKSYIQVRRDWNTLDTFQIIAEKLGKPISEVFKFETLSEGALLPIIEQRKYIGKDKTVPHPIQEKAIEILLPKIKAGEIITKTDSIKAISEAMGKLPEVKLIKCECCGEEFKSEEIKHLKLCGICSAEFLVWFQEAKA